MSQLREVPRAATRGGAPRAFTLLEVLIAMAIFAGSVLAILGALSLSAQTTSRAQRLQRAVDLAELELANAITQLADALESASGNSGMFTWSRTYAGRPHGLVLATVKVQWLDRGEPQVFELAQLFVPTARDSGG